MTLGLAAPLGAAIVSALLGLAVLILKRGSRIHLYLALGLLALAAERTALFMSLRSVEGSGLLACLQVALAAIALATSLILGFVLTFAQPEGRRGLSRGWLGLLTAASLAGVVLIWSPGFFTGQAGFVPPADWVIALGWAGKAYFSILLVMSTLVIAGLERTLMASTGHARWQVKFLLLGLGGIFACRIFTASNAVLYSQVDTQWEIVNSLGLLLASLFLFVGLRRSSGSSEVDLYVSHAVLHRSITLLAVGIYLVAMALAVHFARFVQIPYLQTLLVLATFLLLAAGLFSDRLRLAVRRFVSRHFKRPLYDYRMVWRSFTQRTAALVDRGELSRTLVKLVSETLDVLSVTVWLVSTESGGVRMEASTALNHADGRRWAGHRQPFQVLIEAMQEREQGVDLEENDPAWCSNLRQEFTDFFDQTMIRYCFPLRTQRGLLGLLTLEGRVRGRPLTIEDHDLLQVICDQAAAQMLNIELSSRLRRAREMEVFQNMSAFFIHDLKNLASRLALTADNLPKHFDKPEFREDAIRVMQRSVNKIKTFCARLSTLQKRGGEREQTDLNQLVQELLAEIEGSLGVDIAADLGRLPALKLNGEQFHSVIINLLTNAAQASPSGGTVYLTSRTRNGTVEFSVRDEGCGMSPEFMERRLFRPFQTTKKEGMGIGLYQSKLIVESHHGHIEVKSNEGEGTTFRICLPVEQGADSPKAPLAGQRLQD